MVQGTEAYLVFSNWGVRDHRTYLPAFDTPIVALHLVMAKNALRGVNRQAGWGLRRILFYHCGV